MKLYQGDCLSILPKIATHSIDMILCDLPYGTTQCRWDSIIPLEPMWIQYRRVLKPYGVVILTASQPFTSVLVMSNLKWFRHEWIWIKNRGSNFANVKREPFKEHESILVFSEGSWTYNRQLQERTGGGKNLIGAVQKDKGNKTQNYGSFRGKDITLSELRVPSSWQKFNTDTSRVHPTVKPVPLMQYFIRTYSNKTDTVLDNAMGSGTTGVACILEGREFIGIEKDPNYFKIAKRRINETLS